MVGIFSDFKLYIQLAQGFFVIPDLLYARGGNTQANQRDKVGEWCVFTCVNRNMNSRCG